MAERAFLETAQKEKEKRVIICVSFKQKFRVELFSRNVQN